MTILFDRPVGASADVKELEYISALHQTDPAGVREDGSIMGKKKLIIGRATEGVYIENTLSLSILHYCTYRSCFCSS
jgi:hypothetical protein